jgi:hypothetical protein
MLGEAAAAALRSAVALRGASAAAMLLLSLRPALCDPKSDPGWRELSIGTDVSSHVWLIYSSATLAPYGHMFESGVRFRAGVGAGGYTYTGPRSGSPQSFRADSAFADALVGYLQRFGPLTAKAFVGIAAIEHDIRPLDPENPVQGSAYGPKLVAEFWLNLGAVGWTSLDLCWTSAHQTYSGRVRAGYRVYRDVSVGAEGRVNGNALDKDARGGLFVRYAWDGGEISLAGGVAGRFLEDAQDMTDPYATATWLVQF